MHLNFLEIDSHNFAGKAVKGRLILQKEVGNKILLTIYLHCIEKLSFMLIQHHQSQEWYDVFVAKQEGSLEEPAFSQYDDQLVKNS